MTAAGNVARIQSGVVCQAMTERCVALKDAAAQGVSTVGFQELLDLASKLAALAAVGMEITEDVVQDLADVRQRLPSEAGGQLGGL